MQNQIAVKTKEVRFPVAEEFYGLFFEDINRSGDGGLYPEMIRNRSFEDSLTPGGCQVEEEGKIFKNRGGWPGAFNHGEGMDDWAEAVPYTPIPGWYTKDAQMELEQKETLNEKREAALRVRFSKGGKLWNIGYAGVPVKEGAAYSLYVFVKAQAEVVLKASLEGEDGSCYGDSYAVVRPFENWQRLDFLIHAHGEDYKGRLALTADRECEILFGFTSLMPKETYKGHGLRADLAEMLKNSHPKFLRFPGGCIVEGVSLETAMRFSNTIGPVWKRPSHNLMWHYRTTNGLGYHEYLQLCEDLDMEPMYVCNCGMSCQARVAEFFDEDTVDSFLQEALGALEYALGPEDSKYGAMRKEAGHPEPFRMKYVEIGNENWGPEYNTRYEKFYKVLKEKYPDIIYISNCHTEKSGLPTEIADEHYYNTPEFFMENENRFDSYDRSGPDIFVGEYAVNGGNTIASMECALAEAAFLAGAERNQDIVKLTAYAPLFQNSDYTSWKPNLIVFDNHQVYGIPSYHMISMMAGNRGKEVLEVETQVEKKPPVYKGIPGLLCEKAGLQFKNARINGQPVEITKTIYGGWKEENGVYTMVEEKRPHPCIGKSQAWNKAMEEFQSGRRRMGQDTDSIMWVAFGKEDLEEYTFEIDLKFERENAVTLSVWNYHPNTDAGCNEPKDPDWNLFSVRNQIWKIEDGKGVTETRSFFERDLPEPEKTDLDVDFSGFNTYTIKAYHDGYECYINGELVQKKEHVQHPVLSTVATQDENTVFVKLVHVGDQDTDVQISLDCEVLPNGETEVLSAPLNAVNSMEEKNHVAPQYGKIANAGRTFTYRAPAYSVNILKLKKA